MYNPQKIIELLEERGIKNVDFLNSVTKGHSGALAPVINSDIKVSKLEKIADFFGVSIDTFFERDVKNSIIVGGSGNKVNNLSVNAGCEKDLERHIKELETKIQNLETLLNEKEERITLLKDMIEMLKMQNPK
ncbi:MAG: hypothetical protein NC212_08925 [Staphylococcus sp.]|nr:hypothetical protein [Staphylococcus sp.]